MGLQKIFDKAFAGERISHEEALRLWREAPLHELAAQADRLRAAKVANPEVVTWQIDRNINTTNVCVSGCRFCNFHCKPHQTDRHYITSLDEYIRKTEEMFALGGDQLLLQGGMHPALGIEYYEELFCALKEHFPFIGNLKTAYNTKSGGFSATGRTKQGYKLLVINIQIDGA